MKHLFFLIQITYLLSACGQNSAVSINRENIDKIEGTTPIETNPMDYKKDTINTVIINESNNTRDKILRKLSNKIENKIPLVVHVKVPLCDNKNQGIIPTSESLGNGLDLKRNLYWATSKGMKRYFNELKEWKLMRSTMNPSKNVLERVVFKKVFRNGAVVYLIADAYRGDKMINCLADHFNSLSGVLKDTLQILTDTIGIYGNADLLAFNGHNGLMDETVFFEKNSDGIARDAVTIACISGDYFKSRYQYTNSYPLVHTTNLLYPGAFILEEVINSWATLASDKECKIAAGNSYYKHKPKSGPNGSQNLFSYGW